MFGIGIVMTAVLTLLTPLAAYTRVELLILVRALEGFFEVKQIQCILMFCCCCCCFLLFHYLQYNILYIFFMNWIYFMYLNFSAYVYLHRE